MFSDLVEDLDNYSPDPDKFLDVPFVPTDEAVVEAMLELAEVGPKDVLYDLGSGDGRIVVAAARDRNTRCIGIELDPLRIADAMEYAGDSGVEYLVDFIEGDIFTEDFSEATVVTLYLLDSVNLQLRPRLLDELRPGTRIVSHAFNMGDWKADETLQLSGVRILKWIVPAKVAGVWEWNGVDGEEYRVELQQKHQEVTGEAWVDGRPVHLRRAKLQGPNLELQIELGETDKGKQLKYFTLTFEDNELESVWDQSE